MSSCYNCAVTLTGRQRRWCSRHCESSARAKIRKQELAQAKADGYQPAKPYTASTPEGGLRPEVLERVHDLYPSTARDWDIDMVEACWDRLSTLLPRRLTSIDAQPDHWATR